MSGIPPKATPAQVSAAIATESGCWIPLTLTQAWTLLNGALGYWLPHGLNEGVRSARSARRAR